jgi:hypothetical protein
VGVTSRARRWQLSAQSRIVITVPEFGSNFQSFYFWSPENNQADFLLIQRIMNQQNTDTSTVQRGTLHLSGVDPDQPLQTSFIIMMTTLGLLWIGLGIFSDSPLSQYGHIGLGLVLLLSLAYMKWVYKAKYLRFDEEGVAGLVDKNESIVLNWEAIDQIKLSRSKLVLVPKDGVEIPLSLGQLPYSQHKDVLPQFEQVADRNGVSIKKG